MRALVRFHWIVPTIALPLCVVLASLGVQAAAFRRPTRDELVAARALSTLLRYGVMRATETIGDRTLHSICLQGWFHAPSRGRSVRGALVLISDGERIYDFGKGIRRVDRAERATGLDRGRFLLAGCPRFLGAELGRRLVRNVPVDVDASHADGFAVDSIVFGSRAAPIVVDVTRRAYLPVAVTLSGKPVRGSSDLEPGGGRAAAVRVRRAFHLPPPRAPHRA